MLANIIIAPFFISKDAVIVFKLTMLVDGVSTTKFAVEQQILASTNMMVILR